MYLGLAVLTAVALRFAALDAVVLATALAWATFNLLHLIYHLTRLQMYDTRDRILVVASLAILLAFSAALLIPGAEVGDVRRTPLAGSRGQQTPDSCSKPC
jgi:hypothetical protein